eukprot:GHVR01001461.1.p1 GENE.GHVR01001461.1~~GHVR01001461.1.p1  ORF type:complete len:151 (-),score=42.98 GHVR01001461.1:319-771(-)
MEYLDISVVVLIIISVITIGCIYYMYISNKSKNIIKNNPYIDNINGNRKLTLDELSVYDGSNGVDIYVALKGIVYNITSHENGRKLYGPGEGYHCFAGKDVTRALAKMSFDSKEFNQSEWTDLSEEEVVVLSNWINKYKLKYSIVGEVIF